MFENVGKVLTYGGAKQSYGHRVFPAAEWGAAALTHIEMDAPVERIVVILMSLAFAIPDSVIEQLKSIFAKLELSRLSFSLAEKRWITCGVVNDVDLQCIHVQGRGQHYAGGDQNGNGGAEFSQICHFGINYNFKF